MKKILILTILLLFILPAIAIAEERIEVFIYCHGTNLQMENCEIHLLKDPAKMQVKMTKVDWGPDSISLNIEKFRHTALYPGTYMATIFFKDEHFKTAFKIHPKYNHQSLRIFLETKEINLSAQYQRAKE